MLRVDIGRRTGGDHRDNARVSGQDPTRGLLHLASPLPASVGGVANPLVRLVELSPLVLLLLAGRHVPHKRLDLRVDLHPTLVVVRQATVLACPCNRYERARAELTASELLERACQRVGAA
jgi:hypothetical protein